MHKEKFEDTTRYHKRPQDTTRYHKIPQDTTRYHKIPQDTTRYHKIPQETTRYHNIPQGVIRSRKQKDRQYNGQDKNNGQTLIYNTLHRKLKIEEQDVTNQVISPE
jgi:hypothetical protein